MIRTFKDNEGRRGKITNFSRDEKLEDAIVANVTAKLAVFGSWYGGAAA